MKNIWILNHYATNSYFNEGGRHYWFAEELLKKGYSPTIFCANTRHNTGDSIEVSNEKYISKSKNSIPYIFIKSQPYAGNVLVGQRTWLGIGSTIVNNITIDEDIMIGSNGNVIQSIKEKGIYVGSPVVRRMI